MSIHNQQEVSIGGGVSKKIEASSMKMILDNLQKDQYQHPIKSTVRELISNAVDSMAEREVARKILSGVAKVEDFYVEKEGEEYQDSKFDATYYDLNWLSHKESVNLTYIVGSASERDKVIITDEGVGLGDYRLEKYFSIGYSTKRLSKLLLGKFGIGGKAALSIGDAYFTMESRYNGRLFRFNVYSHSFDSLIPALDLNTGRQNEFILFNKDEPEEYKAYWEPTTDKNGVKVIISAKKTHKQQYIDAVKSQLLYFNNVDFNIIENGESTNVDFRADILYEDEYIILSDNKYWEQPHLLLNRVNYGYINFAELELEDKKGNIGIKIAPEDVEINPSRESIKWSDTTKQTVLDRFSKVVDIASKFIQKELQEEDYLYWIRACYNISNKGIAGEDTIVGRLAKIVDLSSVKPAFLPEPKLKFQQTKVFNGLYVREVCIKIKTVANRKQHIVDRAERKTMNGGIINLPIYLMKQGERANNRRDKFLIQEYAPYGFLMVMEPLSSMQQLLTAGATEETAQSVMAWINKEGEEGRNLLGLTWEHLSASAGVIWYEDVEVPDTFVGTNDAIDEEDVIDPHEKERQKLAEREESRRLAREEEIRQAQLAKKTAAERRKEQGKILMYTPRAVRASFNGTSSNLQKIYEWQKLEMPIAEMNDWDASEIYYAVGPEQDQLMHFVALLTRDTSPTNNPLNPVRKGEITEDNMLSASQWKHHKLTKQEAEQMENIHKVKTWDGCNCQHFYGNKEIILIKTSIANNKFVQDFQSIYEFFSIIRNKTLTMSNILIRWNTARVIKDKLAQGYFLWNFQTFNPQYANLYHRLVQYVEDNYREVSDYTNNHFFGLDPASYGDLIKHLNQVQQFQEFVATNPTAEEIGEMAKFMFGNSELTDGHAVDPVMMRIMIAVQDYVNTVGPMLNYMPILTGDVEPGMKYKKGIARNNARIPMALEMEIKSFLEHKGVMDYNEKELEEFETGIQGQPVEVYEGNQTAEVAKVYKASPDDETDLEIPSNQQIIQTF